MTQVKSEWEFLGKGSYNKAYVNQTKTEVLKIQLDSSETDNPERSVRLWNAINSDKGLPPARIDEQRKGWICPFVSGKQANDVEMRKALIDIFNKTGRIVVDAISPKNFLKTDKGSIICVDIGLAVQLERNEEQKFIQRRKSITSLNAWDNDRDLYIPYFRDNYRTTPQTIDTIKALLFIKENHPQSYDVSFLKNNLSLTQLLSNAYFLPDQHPTKNNALGALIAAVKVQHQEIPIKYKEACTDYRDKLHKIEEIKKNTLNSPKLSPEEKKFINTVFSTLTETILNHHHDLLNIPNKTIANIETKNKKQTNLLNNI